MNWRKFFFESLSLLISAVLCALVSNSMAGRERKLAIVGEYPNALTMPQRSPDVPQAVPAPAFPPAVAPGTDLPPAAASPGSATPVPSPPGTGPLMATPAPSATSGVDPAPAKDGAAPRIIEKPLSEKDLLLRFPPSKDRPYREVPPQDVPFLHQSGMLFLDARRTNVYEEGHIDGSRSMPVWESDINDRILALVSEGRNNDLPIVIYCSGGDCEDSHMLAERLFGAGFSNLLVYREGYPDWVKRGGKTARGTPQ